MKDFRHWIVFFFISILAHSNILHCHVLDTPSTLIDLTKTELDNHCKAQEPTIIMAHMTHCAHCKTTMVTLEKLKRKYPKINFVTVNGPEKNLPENIKALTNGQCKIIGYPSLLYVKNKKIQHLQTGGMAPTIEENIKKHLLN